MSEAVTQSAVVMDDLGMAPGAGPGKTNFYVQNRQNQYMSIADAVVVRNGGTPVVNSGATAYTYQRLGGIVRFSQPQTLTQTNSAQTLTGTAPVGTFQLQMTDENGVIWTTPAIAATATSGAVTTGIAAATPSIVNPGYTNPFAGSNIVTGGGAIGTAPLTLTAGAALAGQYIPNYVVLSAGLTSGTIVQGGTNGGSGITIDYKSIPMYFLKGARNLGNTSTAQKIDTTGSGDVRMNAVPGRPDDEMSFGLVTGPKITLANGTVMTIENRLLRARDAAEACVFAFIDDTTDPLQPRDALYGFVGNATKTRQLNAVIERQFTIYPAVPDDGSSPLGLLDFLA